jgi:hypothetical protein
MPPGRVPIMAGAGANSTAEAIELTRFAKQVGADCHALRWCPTTTSRRRKASTATSRPSPRRWTCRWCCTTCPAARWRTCSTTPCCAWPRCPASSASRKPPATSSAPAWLIKQAPKGFSIYSGDDGTAVALMLLGGQGNVSVTANVAPRLMHELCMAAIEGDVKRATQMHLRLLPLHKQLFCEPSPAPTKWAMSQAGPVRPHGAPADRAADRGRPGRWSARPCATPACWPEAAGTHPPQAFLPSQPPLGRLTETPNVKSLPLPPPPSAARSWRCVAALAWPAARPSTASSPATRSTTAAARPRPSRWKCRPT